MRTTMMWTARVIVTAAFVSVIAFWIWGSYKTHLVSGYLVDQRILKVKEGQLAMAYALQSYYADYGQYPPWSTGLTSVNRRQSPSLNTACAEYLNNALQSEGVRGGVEAAGGLPRDPFGGDDVTFSYYSRDKSWVLWSPGPDEDHDLNVEVLASIDISPDEVFYELIPYRYDPENGFKSSGDLVRSNQISR